MNILKALQDAAERIRNDYGRPTVTFHNPRCKKLKSTTTILGCDCGAEPLDAIFEKELKG